MKWFAILLLLAGCSADDSINYKPPDYDPPEWVKKPQKKTPSLACGHPGNPFCKP